jgi:hypothetical protein
MGFGIRPMLKRMLLASSLLAPIGASADVVATSGLVQITAPGYVDDNFLVNQGLPPQVYWLERKSVTLATPLTTDTGVIPAGTAVDSYFVAFNTTTITSATAWINFDAPILGMVWLDQLNGFASPNFSLTDFLGSPGTTYLEGSCYQCGFEAIQGTPGFNGDTALLQAYTAILYPVYSGPGDFARIIVADPVPVPGPIVGTGIPGLLGLLGMWWYRRQRDATPLILLH